MKYSEVYMVYEHVGRFYIYFCGLFTTATLPLLQVSDIITPHCWQVLWILNIKITYFTFLSDTWVSYTFMQTQLKLDL